MLLLRSTYMHQPAELVDGGKGILLLLLLLLMVVVMLLASRPEMKEEEEEMEIGLEDLGRKGRIEGLEEEM